MKLHVLLAAFLFSISLSARAESVQAELASQGLVGEPGNWQQLKNLFGMPYVLIEPEKKSGEFRANISITPLGKAEKSIPSKFFEETSGEYAEGRKSFLQSNQGKLIRFQDPKHGNRDSATRVHSFGYEYSMMDQEYHEVSHYVFCKTGEMFIVKGLSSRSPASIRAMKTKMERFRCGGSR